MTRERTAVVARYSTARRLVLGSVRAGRRAAPMHGLLTIDVTDTRARLRALDTPGSFTAMVLVAVARAAAAHPEVHAYRDWRGRLVSHRYADVTVLVEVVTSSGPVASKVTCVPSGAPTSPYATGSACTNASSTGWNSILS